jgi:hypothetical protein
MISADEHEQAPHAAVNNTRKTHTAIEIDRTGNNGANEDIIDDLPPFNPKEFQHVPILAAHHAKIKNISDAWTQGSKEALDSLSKLIRESAVAIGDADPDVSVDLRIFNV